MSSKTGLLGFTPRFWPTLIAGTGILCLLALGTWQVFRHAEKAEINAFRAARAAEAPVALPVSPPDLGPYEFRRVELKGTFAHDRELYVYARSQRGNDGFAIVTPLLRDGAPAVLVNRGWVPKERKEPQRRAEGQVSGPVSVTGFLRRDPRRGWLMPDNDAAGNHWFWFDLAEMQKKAGLDRMEPYYIEADLTPNPGGFPIGGQTQIELPDPHLQYAFTWFSLALALLVIYIVWSRKPV
jgi:surfeit locus 1 family protein